MPACISHKLFPRTICVRHDESAFTVVAALKDRQHNEYGFTKPKTLTATAARAFAYLLAVTAVFLTISVLSVADSVAVPATEPGGTPGSVGDYGTLRMTLRLGTRITVTGEVFLDLRDGGELTVNDGIEVSAGNSLTIYGTGMLTAKAPAGNHAVIGGGNGGIITIGGALIFSHTTNRFFAASSF